MQEQPRSQGGIQATLRLTKLRLRINLRTFQKVEPLKSEKLIARLLSPPEGDDGEPLAACSTQTKRVCPTKPRRKANNILLPTPHLFFWEKGRRHSSPWHLGLLKPYPAGSRHYSLKEPPEKMLWRGKWWRGFFCLFILILPLKLEPLTAN